MEKDFFGYLLHGNMKNETDTETEKTIYYISRGFMIEDMK